MDMSRHIGENGHHPVAALPPPQDHLPASREPPVKDYEVPVTAKNSYVGHDEYLGGQVPLAETEDAATGQRDPPSRENEVADLDLQFLQLRKALDLPTRATRESMVDAFMERCHPWMPIVERRWLEEIDGQRRPSLLLLQAVFLAGSRVTSSPLMYTSSAEFYERARALFFHGHEKNTTLAIVAVCLLQWWNPTGPEKFSTNTSGFWVRIGTELAYQVGLHKEPLEGPFRSFRRRLWWTLVVSSPARLDHRTDKARAVTVSSPLAPAGRGRSTLKTATSPHRRLAILQRPTFTPTSLSPTYRYVGRWGTSQKRSVGAACKAGR